MIPIGFLAAAGARAAGDFVLLDSRVLTSAEASVTFSSLGSYSGTYKHLQLRVAARSNRSDTADSLACQFNADTASNYREHVLFGDGSNVSSAAGSLNTFITAMTMAGNSATANNFGVGVIDILDPFETTKNKTLRSLSGLSTNWIQLRSGLHMSTSSMTSIKLYPANGTNLLQYSRFSLYGVK